MRSLFLLLLTLAVAFGAVREGAVSCACSCGGTEEVCPCGRNASDIETPSGASVPNCAPHASGSSYTALCPAVIQTCKKTNTALDSGKLFLSMRDFPKYSAFQPPINLRSDLLRGPPKLNAFKKTNTRLAALSTLMI